MHGDEQEGATHPLIAASPSLHWMRHSSHASRWLYPAILIGVLLTIFHLPIASIGLLRGTFADYSSSSASSSLLLPTQQDPSYCHSSAVTQGRNEAMFWTFTQSDEGVRIFPRNETLSECGTLAFASFYVRALSADAVPHPPRAHALVRRDRRSTSEVQRKALEQTFVLLQPVRKDKPGVYFFPLPAVQLPHSQRSQLELEIRLDFGFIPEGHRGIVCVGDPYEPCTEDNFSSEIRWSGDPLLPTPPQGRGQPPTRFDLPQFPSLPSTPLCTDLSSLPGVWSGGKYWPHPNGQPCELLPLSLASLALLSSDLIWIRFIGDSNSRYLLRLLARVFHLRCSDYAIPGLEGKFSKVYVCWNSGIVLTFRWWYFGDENGPLELGDHLNQDLQQFLFQNPLLKGYPSRLLQPLRPHRTYVSLGSHHPDITGPTLSLQLQTNYTELFTKHKSRGLRLVLVTAVDEKHIIPTVNVRNNVIIAAKNGLATAFASAVGVPVLDFYSISNTVGPQGHRDWIHFLDEVYGEMGGMVMVDALGSEAPTVSRL